MSPDRVSVFISATTRDLGSCREVVKESLLTDGIFPVVQENFPPSLLELREFLRLEILECDAVVCLVGFVHGAAPIQEADPPRSYTQLEYDMALELNKPVLVLMADDSHVPDRPTEEPAALRDCQLRHRRALMDAGHKCEFFTSAEQLEPIVARVVPDIRDAAGRRPMFYLHPPRPPAYFTNRHLELSQIGEALIQKRPGVIAVLGMGGQGKTSLLHRALTSQARFPFAAGFWCTAYRGGFTFEMFLDEALAYLTAGKFDKREHPEAGARAAHLVKLVQERPVLLVIDGIERWLRAWNEGEGDDLSADTEEERAAHFEGLDEFLLQMSGLANGTHLVLTSRALPAVLDDAECAFVPVYDETEEMLRGLEPEASTELLQSLGVKGDPDRLREAAEAYGHHPLALTVLGRLLSRRYGGRLARLAKVKVLDPRRALHRLLEEAGKSMPGRKQAESLMKVAAQGLENLSLDALSAGLGEGAPDEDEIAERAVTLHDWSFLHWDGAAETVSLHPLLKDYYASLTAASKTREINERLAAWYEGQEIPDRAASLDQARPRILAIEHALRSGSPERCERLLFAALTAEYTFVEWMMAWGHASTAVDVIGRVAVASPEVPRARLLSVRAAFQRRIGALDSALADLELAIGVLGEASPDDAYGLFDLAGALANRGNVLWQLSRLEEAIAVFRRAKGVTERLSRLDSRGLPELAAAKMNLGIALTESGRFSEGEAECAAAISSFRDLEGTSWRDIRPDLAQALTNHARILADLCRTELALEGFSEAMSVLESLAAAGREELLPSITHAKAMRASVYADAGRCTEGMGDADEAIRDLHCLVAGGRMDLEERLAIALVTRSRMHHHLKEYRAALEDVETSLRIYERLVEGGRSDLYEWMGQALLHRFEARHALEDPASEEDLERGLQIVIEQIRAGEPELRVMLLRRSAAAAVLLHANRPDRARDLLEFAIAEAEAGIAAGEAVEALQIEASRAREEIESSPLAERPEFRDQVERLIRMEARG